MLAEPVVWLLFERGNFTEHSTQQTVGVLMMYMVGLLPFGLAKLFSLYLYASHRQAEAAKIATYSLVANIIASLSLMKPFGAQGLALAGSIGGWVLFIFTVRAVGAEKFWSMVKSRKSFYFLTAIISFAGLLYFVNIWLVHTIRG